MSAVSGPATGEDHARSPKRVLFVCVENHAKAFPDDDWSMAMSTVNLRLPDPLHKQARALAKRESMSVSQLITLALAEKLSAWAPEEYLGARVHRASRRKFRRIMAKVPNVQPHFRDRLA